MENVAQSDYTFELELLVHDQQTMDAGIANGVKNGVESVIQ